ncbi:MAG: hypothetical protein QNJ03_02970 [Dinoroseobacter sp.]|nr:hypothetical protein [Dinoroseobacter sp.]
MSKTVFVIFAIVATTLALSSGVFAVSLGERSAEAVLSVMIVATIAALPISWFLAKSRAVLGA